jgi:hypothetical protein
VLGYHFMIIQLWLAQQPFMPRLLAITNNCESYYFSKSTNILYHQDSQPSQEKIFTIDNRSNLMAESKSK